MLTPTSSKANILRPYGQFQRLWSLWDVIRVKLDYLVAVAQFLESAAAKRWSRSEILLEHGSLPRFIEASRELGLVVAMTHASEILERIERHAKRMDEVTSAETRKKETHAHDRWLVQELQNLADGLRRELKTKVGIILTDSDAGNLFENARPFDDSTVSVNDRFPDAAFDAQEAASCLALSRPTACVFHLMRVLEIGLNALATDLNIPWPSRNDWQDVINAIEGKIKLYEKGSGDLPPDWREKRQSYADAATQFTHFKDGWRNYALHAHQTYDDGKADMIYRSVREFMRVLAQRLSSISAAP